MDTNKLHSINAKYIWHGEWSDPEIVYKGEVINYYDFEDYAIGDSNLNINDLDADYLISCLECLINKN